MHGGCENYQWDMRQEFALAEAPSIDVPVYSAADAGVGPAPVAAKLRVRLLPTDTVRFLVEPERRGKKSEEFAGLVRFSVPVAGTYRVSTMTPVWLEVTSSKAKRIQSNKFEMQSQCAKVHKSAAFPLRAGESYWLQMSASRTSEAHIIITPEP